MPHVSELLGIHYDWTAGPVSAFTMSHGVEIPEQANCQLAVQLFYQHMFNITLERTSALSAEGYQSLGTIVTDGYSNEFFKTLLFGDIIYAEPQYAKRKIYIDSKPFSQLHQAIFIGPYIFHATTIAKETTIWDQETFLKYYLPRRARRILSQHLNKYDQGNAS